MKKFSLHFFAASLLSLALLTGCVTTRTTSGGAVGVDRQQTMMVSSAEVNRSAEKAYQQTLQEAQKKNLLNRDPAQVRRVRQIAARLIPPTAVFRNDAPGWRWEVNVITSAEMNAWCMPGGKIAVYTGIIEKLKLNDDELAAVMGHEMAHALREHGREKVGQAMGVGLAAAVGGAIGAYYGMDASVGQNIIGTVGDLALCAPIRAAWSRRPTVSVSNWRRVRATTHMQRYRCGKKWNVSQAAMCHSGYRPTRRTVRVSPNCAPTRIASSHFISRPGNNCAYSFSGFSC